MVWSPVSLLRHKMASANESRRLTYALSGSDSGRYVSLYNVAGFAQDGKLIIAFDDTRLFALPVTAVQTRENKVR
jgi:hypothetical protein